MFRDVMEEREGNESSPHLTGNSHKALCVGALIESPHGHCHSGVDVLSVTWIRKAEKKHPTIFFIENKKASTKGKERRDNSVREKNTI